MYRVGTCITPSCRAGHDADETFDSALAGGVFSRAYFMSRNSPSFEDSSFRRRMIPSKQNMDCAQVVLMSIFVLVVFVLCDGSSHFYEVSFLFLFTVYRFTGLLVYWFTGLQQFTFIPILLVKSPL